LARTTELVRGVRHRFRTAIQLCNQVAEAHSDRFVPLLERVVDRLHLKVSGEMRSRVLLGNVLCCRHADVDVCTGRISAHLRCPLHVDGACFFQGERPFNAKEEGQLQAMLGLEETELQQLTSLCIYTLQQAAFHNLTPQVFTLTTPVGSRGSAHEPAGGRLGLGGSAYVKQSVRELLLGVSSVRCVPNNSSERQCLRAAHSPRRHALWTGDRLTQLDRGWAGGGWGGVQALGTELSDAGATATPTAAFQHTWAAGREQVVQRLRAKVCAPPCTATLCRAGR
jgi:hypothetical protein